jgi:hypothetical protein
MLQTSFYTFFFLFLFIFSNQGISQSETLGLLNPSAETEDGYVLFTPEKNGDVYLIDNCGEKINTWTFNENPGATCYLLENGNLLRAGKDSLQIRDWDNNVIWTYATTDNGFAQHHDIEPLPNGNVLCLLSETYSDSAMILEGRDTSMLSGTFKVDKLIELQPVGVNGALLVWEWSLMDHLVQDFDKTKSNYGVITDHSELIDVNFATATNLDWSHGNAIDYNDSLDQIIISFRNFSEVFIIDHSTTTLEASGSAGGNSNQGGDILWRWGNPMVYGAGTIADQQLFAQHDVKWVEKNYLNENKISVFNNEGDGTATFSSVHLIDPEIIVGVYTKISGVFTPQNFDWSWDGMVQGTTVFESKKSSMHFLPNGNFIICETSKGRISEISSGGLEIWSYVNPIGLSLQNQFDTPSSNTLFRGEKYPSNYIGFSGKNLQPNGIIEDQNNNSLTCVVSLGVQKGQKDDLSVIQIPVENNTIILNKTITANEVSILNMNGKVVFNTTNYNGSIIPVNLPQGIYLVKFQLSEKTISRKIII